MVSCEIDQLVQGGLGAGGRGEVFEGLLQPLKAEEGALFQNAVSQARTFRAAVPLTGVVLTKLDGTARGGVLVALRHELGLPIRYIGVGEAVDDLRPFDADQFVGTLFAE